MVIPAHMNLNVMIYIIMQRILRIQSFHKCILSIYVTCSHDYKQILNEK